MKTDCELRLSTARLVLRVPCAGDVNALYRIMSDPLIMRYASTPPHRDKDTTSAWLFGHLDDPVANEALVIEEAGEVVGRIASRSGEIGFVIARHRWGCGIASEACQRYIDHRKSVGDRRLIARVDPRNAASLSLLAKLGFQVISREQENLQVGGCWVDTDVLELDVTEWSPTRPPRE